MKMDVGQVEKIHHTTLKSSKEIAESWRNQVSGRLPLLIGIALVILPLLIYWQVQNFEFVNLDDPLYITENLTVRKGLTKEGAIWAFAFNDVSYWHPLTWLSHMLDCQLYGLDPRGHHFNNILLHIASTLLLFFSLKAMTGQTWKSAAVAAMFSLHPLNVESVAWVANRKGVLSTFFWTLTLWTYVRYARNPRTGTYSMVLIPFVLGLLSKPTMVTLPFVLLLLDYWPLDRLHTRNVSTVDRKLPISADTKKGKRVFPLIAEKIPLIALSAATVSITYLSSLHKGIIIAHETVPMSLRFENAVVSYAKYLVKMAWPSDLAVFYPFPEAIPFSQLASAAALLLCITGFVIWKIRSAPYLAVGWLWYLGTLVPVIGFMQHGLWPGLADRFSYIPLIGLFIMLAWGLGDLFPRQRLSKIIPYTLLVGVFLSFSILAWIQVRYWKNSKSLFEHALNVTKRNHLAHYNLGAVFHKQGNIEEALLQYSKALDIMPDNAQFQVSYGSALLAQESIEEAIVHFSEALRMVPDYAEAHLNMGAALSKKGKTEEALSHYREAIAIKPLPEAHHSLGLILAGQGKFSEALYHYEKALSLKPDYAQVHNDLGVALFYQGKTAEAISHFKEALRIKPDYENPKRNLELILRKHEKSVSGCYLQKVAP
jgi:tetratricopeptide (TPR) repeat protein